LVTNGFADTLGTAETEAAVCTAGLDATRVVGLTVWLVGGTDDVDTDVGDLRVGFSAAAVGDARCLGFGAPVDAVEPDPLVWTGGAVDESPADALDAPESDGFASAIPGVVAIAVPTPSATASAPTRPTQTI
jgi:hypothetical protein